MIKVALKGLAGRKLRAALTAFAIVLGVAMVSGTYVLTDTIKKGFDSVFTAAYSNADAVITGKTLFGSTNSAGAPSFNAALLAKVNALPAVARAVGGVNDDQAHLVGANGKAISVGGAPNLGYSVDPAHDKGLNPLVLVQGKWPVGANQIVIDASTARHKHYAVGQLIGLSDRGPTRKYRITGLAELGGVASIGGATLAIFDLPTAQAVFHKQGEFDQIYVQAKKGTSDTKLASEIQPILPTSTQVRTGKAEAKDQASDTDAFTSLLQKFLLAFGFVALFVGSFVIANTLSITIAQRTRELATLRTIGATRRQVRTSVLVEALVIGIIASVIGLFSGLALATGLNALFVSFGIDLPHNGTVFSTRTVIVSLVVGILVTLLASLRPAIRATRVPPIAAVREGSVLPVSRFARFGTLFSLVLGGLGITALCVGAFDKAAASNLRLLLVGIGTILLFLGVAFVAKSLVSPITKVVSPVATWTVAVLGIVAYPIAKANGEMPTLAPDRDVNALAARNANRAPARTASTAAALMIGLALVTFVAVLATGLKQTFESAVHSEFQGDYAITSQNGFSPTDITSETAARRVHGVTAVLGVRAGIAQAFGKQVGLTAITPGGPSVISLKWQQGSQSTLDQLGATGAMVDNSYAKTHHLSVGSPIRLLTPYAKTIDARVVGIFKPPKGGSPFGSVTISAATFDRLYPDPQNLYVLLKINGGATTANTATLKNALSDFPDAKVQTEHQFEKSQEKGIDILLNLLYVLLGFSIIISLFGIVNTLVLAVFERTRELGMLRAVGMTRLQVRRMIRQESVITALIGAVLGIPIGIVLALLIGRAIDFSAFAVPYFTLVIFVLAAVLAGVIAAIFPARRASRLNVLEALQYE